MSNKTGRKRDDSALVGFLFFFVPMALLPGFFTVFMYHSERQEIADREAKTIARVTSATSGVPASQAIASCEGASKRALKALRQDDSSTFADIKASCRKVFLKKRKTPSPVNPWTLPGVCTVQGRIEATETPLYPTREEQINDQEWNKPYESTVWTKLFYYDCNAKDS